MRKLMLILSITVTQLTAQIEKGVRLTQLEYLQELEFKTKEAPSDSLFFVYNERIFTTAWRLHSSSNKEHKEISNRFLSVYYNNKGCKKSDLGYYKDAYNNYFSALTYAEKNNDSLLLGEIRNNIAAMFYDQKYYDESIKSLNKSIAYSTNYPENLFAAYTSISSVYFAKNILDSAIVYANKAINHHTGDSSDYAISLCNLASIQYIKKDFSGALNNFQTAFNIYKNINPTGSTMMLSNVAKIYSNSGDIKLAEKTALQLKEFANTNHSLEGIMEAALILKNIYKKQNKCQLELSETGIYYAMRDSILNESNKNALIKRDVQYAYDKKALTDSLKFAEGVKTQKAIIQSVRNKLQKEKTQRYAIIVVLLMVCIFTALIINRFLLIRRQKSIISEQKS